MENPKQGEFSAFLHLVKSCIGTGVLAMPIAFKYAGLIMGTLGLIFTAIVCTYCTYLIIVCSNYINKVSGTTLSSFADVAEASCTYGPKWAHKYNKVIKSLMNGGVFLGYYSCLSIYTVIIAMNLEKLITFYWTPIDLRLYMAALFLPFLLISYIPSWKYLAPVSMITNAFMIFGLGIIIYYLISDLPSEYEKELIGDVTKVPTFFSIVIFSLQIIGAALPLKNNMKEPEKFLGYFGVLNKACLVVTFLYFIIGFFGYFCYGSDTKENITLNLPSDSYAAQAVQLLITLSVFGAYGVQFFVSLEILWEALTRHVTKHIKLTNYIIRTVMILIAVLVAIAVPTITPFISLVICSNYINKVSGSTFSSIADVAEASCRYGPKWAHKYDKVVKNMMNVGVFIGYYSSLSIYTVIIAMNLEKLITFYWTPINLRLYMAVLFVPFLLISYIPNWKLLAPVSMITNVLLVSGLGITVYFLISDLPSEHEKELFGDVAKIPTFLSIVIFAMQTIGAALPLKNNMKDPTKFLGYFGVLNKNNYFIKSMYSVVWYKQRLEYLRAFTTKPSFPEVTLVVNA
ncbi:hypothetical protein RN001_009742 [Aquatica leii]|uniref:Amino acid transporter transmembrane domain-containing protein n=1 Tax=Aquatica leii TaxID=1421715 RepID=A0AAN7P951_9COLE|nr:hypothetical protein RN001_009742 [Aquatica leii]